MAARGNDLWLRLILIGSAIIGSAMALTACGGLSRAGLEPEQQTQIEQACPGGLLEFNVVKGSQTSDAEVADYASCQPIAFCLNRPKGEKSAAGPDNLLAFFLMQTTRYGWKVSHPGGQAASRVGSDGHLEVRLGGWYPENRHAVGSAYAATYYQQSPGSRLRWAMVHAPPMIAGAKRELVTPWLPPRADGVDTRMLRLDVEVRAAHAPAMGKGSNLFDLQGRLKQATDRPRAIQHLKSGYCRFTVELEGARAILRPPAWRKVETKADELPTGSATGAP